ncbi:MAG TPA: CBS domain-containing protein [Candidatus Altiarchaeales archaeon]|nr:CBS domain-containing protein [Candidatus Altiarchaeales archaeon]
MNALNKKIKNVMTRGVVTAEMGTTVRDVIKILSEENIHGIAVIAPDDEIVGVITDTDIINAVGEDLDKLTADDIMSSNIKKIGPENTLRDAAEIMKKEKNSQSINNFKGLCWWT